VRPGGPQRGRPCYPAGVYDPPYMERTRAWYEAQGYERAYRWAHFDDVPFAHLAKPLSDCRVALVTTGSEIGPDGGPVLPKRVYRHAVASPPERLYSDDLGWDKQATHMDDRASYLPLEALQELVAAGWIGSLTKDFHGVPTEYSQRRTIEIDAPELLGNLRDDGADAALLVPI